MAPFAMLNASFSGLTWLWQITIAASECCGREDSNSVVDDMVKLSYLHEPGVLNNLMLRYQKNLIYVTHQCTSPRTRPPTLLCCLSHANAVMGAHSLLQSSPKFTANTCSLQPPACAFTSLCPPSLAVGCCADVHRLHPDSSQPVYEGAWALHGRNEGAVQGCPAGRTQPPCVCHCGQRLQVSR